MAGVARTLPLDTSEDETSVTFVDCSTFGGSDFVCWVSFLTSSVVSAPYVKHSLTFFLSNVTKFVWN